MSTRSHFMFMLFVYCTCVLCERSAEGGLELVSVVFRHGGRSPVAPLPINPFPHATWPQGFGQLLVNGTRQEYHLGELLKERYIINQTFLAPNYTRVQVYVRSTDYDRTLMSAEAQLAAWFPPGPNQTFNATIPWQPIPVHTVPQEEDNLLRAYGVNCPQYAALREADKHSPEYLQKEEENQEFFKELENETGLNPVNLSNIWRIQDILFVGHNSTGHDLPHWVKPGYMPRLKELSDFDMSLMFNSKEKNRLTAGIWLQKVLSDITEKANNDSDLADAKLFLYSSHDTTVACMMSALGVYDGIQPEYASAFILELISDGNGTSKNYNVKLLYRKFTGSDEITTLRVPGCGNQSMCTLDEFKDLVTPLIPDNWEEECGLTSKGSKSQHAALITFTILFVVAVTTIAILSMVIWYIQNGKKRNITYNPLPSNEKTL